MENNLEPALIPENPVHGAHAQGFAARIAIIDSVRPHGDNLSIVTVAGNEVVANRKEDGSFRWEAGEPCVYVPEGTLVPEDVLKARGYWDEEKGKGLLEGKKGNRVKMRRFAGHESRGLLFKVERDGDELVLDRADERICVLPGEDVAAFLGLTEHKAG